MATFIAIVHGNGFGGYTASFPDFPECSVHASTLDHVISSAQECLLAHIERLLETNQTICNPTGVDVIERGDALLLAAVNVPDDLGIVHVDLAVPALSLARIDSLAQRHGLTRAALFLEAVRRWAGQATESGDVRQRMPDGPAVFDFDNPLVLEIESSASPVGERDAKEQIDIRANSDDITAELARLFGGSAEPKPKTAGKARKRSIRK